MAVIKSEQIKTTWVDGKLHVAVPTQPVYVFDPDRVSATNRARFLSLGVETKLTRAAAIPRDTETGKPVPWAEKAEAIRTLGDMLMEGGEDWTLRRTPTVYDVGLVILAMIQCKVAANPDAAEALLTAAQTKRGVDRTGAAKIFAETKQVAAAMDAIRAERAQARLNQDVNDLVAEFAEM